MLNFISPEQRETLKNEGQSKLILISGIVIFAVLVSVFLVFYSMKIILASRLEVQKINLSKKEGESEIAAIKKLEKRIDYYNLQFSQIDSFYRNQAKPTEILEKIASTMPEGVNLTDFNFSQNKISLSGFSLTRDKLLEFKENLEKDEDIEKINFPSSNLLERENVSFTVSFLYEIE